MKCEPVQQFGVARSLAYASEVFQSLHETRAEQLLPIAVHSHTGRKRLTWSKEPPRKGEPVAWLVGGKFRENSRHIRGKVRSYLGKKVSTLEFQRGPLLIGLLFRHDGKFGGADLGQFPLEVFETRNVFRARRISAQRSPTGVAAQ